MGSKKYSHPKYVYLRSTGATKTILKKSLNKEITYLQFEFYQKKKTSTTLRAAYKSEHGVLPSKEELAKSLYDDSHESNYTDDTFCGVVYLPIVDSANENKTAQEVAEQNIIKNAGPGAMGNIKRGVIRDFNIFSFLEAHFGIDPEQLEGAIGSKDKATSVHNIITGLSKESGCIAGGLRIFGNNPLQITYWRPCNIDDFRWTGFHSEKAQYRDANKSKKKKKVSQALLLELVGPSLSLVDDDFGKDLGGLDD